MIKNIYKNFLANKNSFSIKNRSISSFSTKLAPQKNRLEDWEYVQCISKQIKNNNINEALRYLIQSHLNNQILNKQIYYSLHEKMEQLSAENGYHEILYQLYRENFQPNPMTLSWMVSIAMTVNNNLSNLLKQDFQRLNQAYPVGHPANLQQKSVKNTFQNENKDQSETKSNSLGRKSRKVPTVPSTDDYFTKTPQAIMITKKNFEEVPSHKERKKILQKEPTKQEIQAMTIQKIHQMLERMFSEYGKITLHNVELELNDGGQNYDMDEEINEMYNQNDHDLQDNQNNNQQADEEQTIDDYILQMMSSISKIKIGKVQFQNSHILQKVRNDLRNNKDDENDKNQN